MSCCCDKKDDQQAQSVNQGNDQGQDAGFEVNTQGYEPIPPMPQSFDASPASSSTTEVNTPTITDGSVEPNIQEESSTPSAS